MWRRIGRCLGYCLLRMHVAACFSIRINLLIPLLGPPKFMKASRVHQAGCIIFLAAGFEATLQLDNLSLKSHELQQVDLVETSEDCEVSFSAHDSGEPVIVLRCILIFRDLTLVQGRHPSEMDPVRRRGYSTSSIFHPVVRSSSSLCFLYLGMDHVGYFPISTC